MNNTEKRKILERKIYCAYSRKEFKICRKCPLPDCQGEFCERFSRKHEKNDKWLGKKTKKLEKNS